jgi:hypothetical protein
VWKHFEDAIERKRLLFAEEKVAVVPAVFALLCGTLFKEHDSRKRTRKEIRENEQLRDQRKQPVKRYKKRNITYNHACAT